VTPTAPKRPCREPGCSALVADGNRCPLHKRGKRPSAASRGYDGTWRKIRARYLALNPLCAVCLEDDDRVVSATVVDHITPHQGDVGLLRDPLNLQSLCKRHHDEKTAREDTRRAGGGQFQGRA
jgi:5-methylcytosine-specific restriction protein A